MPKTAGGAYKHIREWRNFFSDYKEVSEILVNEFMRRHRKKKYLQQSLTRLMERGFLTKKNKKFFVTGGGIRFFKQNRVAKDTALQAWDGKWRLISFDVPGDYNIKRNQLRALLKEFNFYLLHKSVWVCPNYAAEDFWKLIVRYDLEKFCKVMVVDILEGDEDLKKHFSFLS